MSKQKAEVVEVSTEDSAIVLSADQADKVRADAIKYRDNVEENYLKLGKVLDTVMRAVDDRQSPVYKNWGFQDFDEYCERELGFRARKGYYLMGAYRQIDRGKLPKDTIKRLDWSKAALLAPLAESGVIDENNGEKWVEKVADKSSTEVRAMVKHAKDKSSGGARGGSSSASSSRATAGATSPEELYHFKVSLFKDQYENLQTAIAKARTITGSDKMPWIIDCIAMAFNSECYSEQSDALDETLKRVERVFGVKLIAIKDENQRVVFGERLAAMISASETKK